MKNVQGVKLTIWRAGDGDDTRLECGVSPGLRRLHEAAARTIRAPDPFCGLRLQSRPRSLHLELQGLLDLLDQHLTAGLIVERHSHPTRVHSPLFYPALRQAPGHL